jgi:hypothetical protein
LTVAAGHRRWPRTFLGLVLANTLLIAAAVNVPDPVTGGLFKTMALFVNMPGIVTSKLVLGDLDARFGPLWAVIITWASSLPWLALGALAIEHFRKSH